jgi:hypothetical protein
MVQVPVPVVRINDLFRNEEVIFFCQEEDDLILISYTRKLAVI